MANDEDFAVPDEAHDDAALEAQRNANGRALASVLRMRILRLCLDDALTNQEIAGRLGKNPATTYHHVRLLAERGFLAAQPERRGARGAREIPYRATRASWHAPMPEGQQDRLLIETFLEEVAEADPTMTTTGRLGMRLGPEGHAELERRLGELMEEFAARPPEPGGTAYSLFIAVHEDAARNRVR